MSKGEGFFPSASREGAKTGPLSSRRQGKSGKKDFLQLRKTGKKIRFNSFFLIYKKNHLLHCRLIFSFPGRLAKASRRNYFKRQARSFLAKQNIKTGWDIMLGFEGKKNPLPQEFFPILKKLFQKFKSLNPEGF